MFKRTMKMVLAFTKANHIKSTKPMPGRLRKISMPTRIQEIIILGGGNYQILVF
jgi:hypothetical protein